MTRILYSFFTNDTAIILPKEPFANEPCQRSASSHPQLLRFQGNKPMITFTYPIRKPRVLADTLVPARTTLSWPTPSSCNRTTGSPGRHLCVFTSDMRLSASLLPSSPLVQCRVFRWKLHDKWEFPASPTCTTTKLFSYTPRPSDPSRYEMRKSHKKSRLGCQTCKKRKIKASSTHHLLTGTLLICRVPLVR